MSDPANARYRALPGETLYAIAKRFTGDGDRWIELLQVNNFGVMDQAVLALKVAAGELELVIPGSWPLQPTAAK